MKNDGSQLAETAEMTEKPWTVWGSKWDLWGEKSVNLIMIPTWYQLTPCWRLVIVSNWKVPLPLKSRPSLGGDFPFEPFQHEDVELCAKVGLSVSVFFLDLPKLCLYTFHVGFSQAFPAQSIACRNLLEDFSSGRVTVMQRACRRLVIGLWTPDW